MIAGVAKFVLLPICALAAGLALGAELMIPLASAGAARSALIGEFVDRYCHPDPKTPPMFLMGEAAALSRLAIASGVNVAANFATAKCKAGIGR